MAKLSEPMRAADMMVTNIAARVSDLRKQRGLSLQEVADRAGITKSHVWEIEQGRSRNPTIATAVGVASALGVSLDYLTGLSSSKPDLHPDALRIACEVDTLIKAAGRRALEATDAE